MSVSMFQKYVSHIQHPTQLHGRGPDQIQSRIRDTFTKMQSLVHKKALLHRNNLLRPHHYNLGASPKAFSHHSTICSSDNSHLTGIFSWRASLATTKSKKRQCCVSKAMPDKGSFLDGYMEVKLDSVRVSSGSSVVFLRLVGQPEHVLPVHIGNGI